MAPVIIGLRRHIKHVVAAQAFERFLDMNVLAERLPFTHYGTSPGNLATVRSDPQTSASVCNSTHPAR